MQSSKITSWVLLLLLSLFWGCGDDTEPIPPTTLVNIVEEPAGENCASGGQRIIIGKDTNKNEILDPEEMIERRFVCNGIQGEQGDPGLDTLVRVLPIGEGFECAHGGQQIQTGLDQNNNGELDDSEIRDSRIICDGNEGKGVVVKTENEPPGGHCINGGKEISMGIDEDRNGILDDEEIEENFYVCDGGELFDRMTDLPNGDICPNGGILYESGFDYNLNHQLDDEEVMYSYHLCHRYVSEMALGAYHSCALRSDGQVFCWGNNERSVLGWDISQFLEHPFPLAYTQPNHYGIPTLIASGYTHNCVLIQIPVQNPSPTDPDTEGHLYCWGSGEQGQLGQGDQTPISVSKDLVEVIIHSIDIGGDPVESPMGQVISLGLGKNHSCAVQESGKLYCWGDNSQGQVGNGCTESCEDVASPTPVVEDIDPGIEVELQEVEGIAKVVAGDNHTCALREQGSVLCWGQNNHKQLGIADEGSFSTAQTVPNVQGIKDIAAGATHTCVVKLTGGGVLCWGSNDRGELGFEGDDTATPQQIKTIDNRLLDHVIDIAAGDHFTCAVVNTEDEDGIVYCWGDNTHEQLGVPNELLNSSQDYVSEFRADAAPVYGIDKVRRIWIGGAHVCAIREGKTWCWGNNDKGELGDGSHEDSWLPRLIDIH